MPSSRSPVKEDGNIRSRPKKEGTSLERITRSRSKQKKKMSDDVTSAIAGCEPTVREKSSIHRNICEFRYKYGCFMGEFYIEQR